MAAGSGGDVPARILAAVRRVPRGRVATYGQIAALAGVPRQPRRVGAVLGGLPERSAIPWHRVLNARGEVSRRGSPVWEDVQRALLADEGVHPDSRGRFDLARHGWRPRVLERPGGDRQRS